MSHSMGKTAGNRKREETVSQLKAEVSRILILIKISSFMEQVTGECPSVSKSNPEMLPDTTYSPVLNDWTGAQELQDEFPRLGANINLNFLWTISHYKSKPYI